MYTVSSCKDAIIGRRRAAALDMPQHGRTHVIPGACLDFIADYLADAVKGLVTELIDAAGLEVHRPFLWEGAFCHTDNAVLLTHLEAAFHRLRNLRDIERLFRYHGVVRTAGHARMQGNPSHVAAHNLHDQDAIMGLRGGVQTVDSIGGHRNRSIETKRVVGGIDVIINGLRHAHYRHAVIRKPLCTLEGTFTTDGD